MLRISVEGSHSLFRDRKSDGRFLGATFRSHEPLQLRPEVLSEYRKLAVVVSVAGR